MGWEDRERLKRYMSKSAARAFLYAAFGRVAMLFFGMGVVAGALCVYLAWLIFR